MSDKCPKCGKELWANGVCPNCWKGSQAEIPEAKPAENEISNAEPNEVKKVEDNMSGKCPKCGKELWPNGVCPNCWKGSQAEIPEVKPTENEISNIESKELEKAEDKWTITISFGKSTSQNFEKALYLAKTSPDYKETVDDSGKPIYQATYSDAPNEFLAFLQLYEMIKSWKSCFVFINGTLVDKKILGGINYCYGDKCRSGNKDFCYGASELTKNPFGCHRLQISAYNNPWASFVYPNSNRINKNAIRARIAEYGAPYTLCPSYDAEKIEKAVNELPDELYKQEPKPAAASLNSNSTSNNSASSSKKAGCAIWAIVIIAIALIFCAVKFVSCVSDIFSGEDTTSSITSSSKVSTYSRTSSRKSSTSSKTESTTEPATEAPTEPTASTTTSVTPVTPTPEPEPDPSPAPTPTPAPEPENTLPPEPGGSNFTGHYYASPSGERYHYLPDCAGKNSQEITWETAYRRGLTPCAKCAY